nr:segregation/condensation protein A [Mycoplasmopsis bovis]
MNNEVLQPNAENKFDIKLENFDGPLDLLLALVQEKNVNIMDVDVFELATAYLKIIEDLQENEIDVASDYLVMARNTSGTKN